MSFLCSFIRANHLEAKAKVLETVQSSSRFIKNLLNLSQRPQPYEKEVLQCICTVCSSLLLHQRLALDLEHPVVRKILPPPFLLQVYKGASANMSVGGTDRTRRLCRTHRTDETLTLSFRTQKKLHPMAFFSFREN